MRWFLVTLPWIASCSVLFAEADLEEDAGSSAADAARLDGGASDSDATVLDATAPDAVQVQIVCPDSDMGQFCSTSPICGPGDNCCSYEIKGQSLSCTSFCASLAMTCSSSFLGDNSCGIAVNPTVGYDCASVVEQTFCSCIP